MARARPYYWRLLDTIVETTDANYREARLTWMRLAPWLDHEDARTLAAIRRHPRKVAEYLALARGYVPPGWPVEVTLRTRGGTYRRVERGHFRRVRDRRPLYVKIRVRARAALPIAEHERAVRLTIQAGAVPQGYTVDYADWEKGVGRRMNAGTIARDVAVELNNFYGALRHKHTEIRADMVAEEEG